MKIIYLALLLCLGLTSLHAQINDVVFWTYEPITTEIKTDKMSLGRDLMLEEIEMCIGACQQENTESLQLEKLQALYQNYLRGGGLNLQSINLLTSGSPSIEKLAQKLAVLQKYYEKYERNIRPDFRVMGYLSDSIRNNRYSYLRGQANYLTDSIDHIRNDWRARINENRSYSDVIASIKPVVDSLKRVRAYYRYQANMISSIVVMPVLGENEAMLFAQQSRKVQLFNNLSFSGYKDRASAYSELVTDYFGPVKVGIGTAWALAVDSAGMRSDSLITLQKFISGGGNAILQFSMPLVYVKSRESQPRFQAKLDLAPRFAADIPLINERSSSFNGNANLGADLYVVGTSMEGRIAVYGLARAATIFAMGPDRSFFKEIGFNHPTANGLALYTGEVGVILDKRYRVHFEGPIAGNKDLRKLVPAISISVGLMTGKTGR